MRPDRPARRPGRSRAAGAEIVVATDPLAHRTLVATACGATHAVHPGELSGVALPGGLGVDVAFETAGEDDALADAIAAVRPGGRVVLVGIPDGDRTSFVASAARRKGLTLLLSRRMKPRDLPRAIRLADSGDVDLASPRRGAAPALGLARTRSRRSSSGAASRSWSSPRQTAQSGVSAEKYAVGIDFGTESGRAVLVSCADGREAGDDRLPVPQRGDRQAPARARTTRSRSSPTGRSRIRTTICARSGRRCRRSSPRRGVDPADVIGVGIDFTSCTMLPTLADGTPLCRAGRPARRTARVGEALEAPRRPDRGGPHQRRRGRARRAVALQLRRTHLVRVVLLEGAADPRRGARGLRARRPPDRGGGLGRLAAHRRRDAQQLHRRLQGDVVEARRLPRRTPTSPRSTPASSTSSTRRCRGRSRRSARGPAD